MGRQNPRAHRQIRRLLAAASLAHSPAWARALCLDGFWPLFVPNAGRTRISHPEAQAIFQKWIDAYQQGVVPPEALAASHRDEVNWFIEGRAAMLPFSGGWITRYFDDSFAKRQYQCPCRVAASASASHQTKS